MNKYLNILIFLVLSASCKTSSRSIIVDSGFIPQKEYLETTIIIDEHADTVVALGDNDYQVKPMIKKDSLIVKYLIRTGKRIGNKYTISIDELDDVERDSPIERLSFGWVNKDKIVELDSVVVGDYILDESWKNEMIETNENILNSKLPFSGKLSIGDTIKIKSFKEYWLATGTYFFELELDELLKLVYIKDGIAYFDIQFNFLFTPVESKYDRRLSYMGKGKAEYDIKNSMFTKYSRDMMIDYTYKYKGKFHESYSKNHYQDIIKIKNN